MKTIKYLVVGAAISISAPTMAQNVDFGNALAPITQALKTNPASAEALAKNYIKEYKKSPEALIALGSSYLSVKNFAKADELAELALSKSKKDARAQSEAYILKGDIEAMKDETGNGGGAATYYAQAKSIDPKNPVGYMRYASIYRKINPKLVEDTYNELRANIPDYPIDAEAGHSFYAGEKYDKAYENYAKCNKESLDEYKLAEYIISAYMINKKEEGFKLADFGSNKFPKSINLARLAMWNAVDTKDFSNGIKYAQKVLNLEGDKSARDYTYYGNALLGNNQYTEAITQFNKALELDPKAAEPLSKISEAYAGLGEEDKALEYSELYMQKNPNASPSDYAKLAQIYVAKADKGIDKATNYSKALAIYDQMANKYKEIASWANMIAAGVADKSGNTDLGASYNQKIVDELANKADRDADETGYLIQALRLLGFHYWSDKGDLESAKPYYEKLIQLEPNDKNAKAALGIE
ncbi:MAG: tetratricopeptide repeat protein [Prevotella sp.]|nr:tetratricopeptide repeat protein [Prevotella sp.]